MKRFIKILAVVALLAPFAASAENNYFQDETIHIWDNKTAPHSNGLIGVEQTPRPYRLKNTVSADLYIYHADKTKSSGQSVLICPGGGYSQLTMDSEGYLMAQWLAKNGVTAFLLKYRLPNGHKEVPMEDAVEALRIIRKNAKKYDINPEKVGIMGFSAGGHLAACISNLVADEEKPNFSILFYPVLTANNHSTHKGSFRNLLGAHYVESEGAKYDMVNAVSESTPPTILLVSDDDHTVPSQGAAFYYARLRYFGIKGSIHSFPVGGHGWGIKENFPYKEEWQNLLLRWLEEL